MIRCRTVLALLLAFGWCRADDPFESQRQLINLTVIALDNRGEPVTDLTAADFQVTDRGKPQKISYFHHSDSRMWQLRPPAPDEFTNRRGSAPPYATVILLDLMNQRFNTRGVAWNLLEQYLTSLESADNLYLYLLTMEGKIYPVHPVPNSETEAQREAQPWTRQIKAQIDEASRAVSRLRPVGEDVAIRIPLTFAALSSLEAEMSTVPGHKNIVWITDGVPIFLDPRRSDIGEFVDFTPQIQRMSEELERSGIAVYPVQQVFETSRPASADTLDEFAQITGGRPDGGKDIGAALKQAMIDVRTAYQLAYYAPAGNWDGKFHKIRVVSTRKGVRIQTKTGYHAWPEPPEARARAAMERAAASSFDAAEIGLRARVTQPNAAGLVRLVMDVDANDVALAHEDGRYQGQLELSVVSYFTDGRSESSDVFPVPLDYARQDLEQVRREGIPLAQNQELGKDVRRIRLIVFDPGSNAIGSLTIPVNTTLHSQP